MVKRLGNRDELPLRIYINEYLKFGCRRY